jgi:hypothetical protein
MLCLGGDKHKKEKFTALRRQLMIALESKLGVSAVSLSCVTAAGAEPKALRLRHRFLRNSPSASTSPRHNREMSRGAGGL